MVDLLAIGIDDDAISILLGAFLRYGECQT